MRYRFILIALALWFFPWATQAAVVSPPLLDLRVHRSEAKVGVFSVVNASAQEQTYYLDTLPFVAEGESGQPRFVPEEADELGGWIQWAVPQVTVPAQSKQEVAFTINVPPGAPGGTRQTALTIATTPSEVVSTNGAAIEAKTAVLLFVTVEGDTHAEVALLDFEKKGPWIQSNLTSGYVFRAQAQGTVYAIPAGTLRVRDVFGRVVYESAVNTAGRRVLPMTTGTFAVGQEVKEASVWMQTVRAQMRALAIGPMRAEMELTFGEGFSPLTTQLTFWYVPWQSMVLVLLPILLILVGYGALRRLAHTLS